MSTAQVNANQAAEHGRTCHRCGGAIPKERRPCKGKPPKYCSIGCVAEMLRNSQRLRKKPPRLVKCAACQKMFDPWRSKKKHYTVERRYCSMSCLNKSRAGINLGLRRWTTADENKLLELRDSGLNFVDIAARLNRTPSAVSARLDLIRGRGAATHIPADSVATILGVTLASVHEWIERAKILEARKSKDGWLIAPRDVRSMLHKDPDLIDLRRVNKRAFLNLLLDPRLA